MAIPVSELQKLNPSARIELFVMELVEGLHYATGNPSNVPTIYRFHAGGNIDTYANIIWQTNTYERFPVEAKGYEFAVVAADKGFGLRYLQLLGNIPNVGPLNNFRLN